MMHGVFIDGVDTLSEYGLALLAELKIGTPEPRTSYVTIPEADGDLDLTGALTGGLVRYGMREISFSLYPVHDIIAGKKSPATEQHAALIRQKLAQFIHGQTRCLWLPDDGGHYFRGRMAVGEKGGFNNAEIPVTMTAEPWRYKNLETVLTISADGVYNLPNETRPVIPIFTATDGLATVTFGGTDYQIATGENRFSGIVLQPGTNTITVSGIGQPVVVRYQEGVI